MVFGLPTQFQFIKNLWVERWEIKKIVLLKINIRKFLGGEMSFSGNPTGRHLAAREKILGE